MKDGARLDIRVQDIWDKNKRSTFLDIRVFHSHVPSNCTPSTEACYRSHEHRRRGVHTRSASLKLSTETSPSWSYPQVEVVNHLPQLLSRGLPASHLKNTNNCTAALSPSSNVGSPSAWSTQPYHAFAPPDLHICSSTENQLFEQPTGPHSCRGPAIYLTDLWPPIWTSHQL